MSRVALFNRSLSTPSAFKAAYITPLLKKTDMDSANPKSYRPIANLSVISKLLERVVTRQQRPHLSLLRPVLTLATASSMWQPRGPGTACRLVSRRRHLYPRSGAISLRHYFLPEAISTVSIAHDKPFSSYAANSFFCLTLLGVLAAILTLRHLNQFIQGRRKQIESGGPISGAKRRKNFFWAPHFSFGPPILTPWS